MTNIEKRIDLGSEKEPKIIIKHSSDASEEVKQNPFYNPEFWGRAISPDDIYLPDSDEAISFAMAAHEIGHLVKKDEINNARLDNFEATRAEEQRAWDSGWEYLQKYLLEYYQDNQEMVSKIQLAFKHIKTILMQATDLSQDMYLEPDALDNLNDEEINQILKDRREKFFSQKGEEFKAIFDKIKELKIGVKPNWDSFTAVVKKAVQDILRDNEKIE